MRPDVYKSETIKTYARGNRIQTHFAKEQTVYSHFSQQRLLKYIRSNETQIHDLNRDWLQQ